MSPLEPLRGAIVYSGFLAAIEPSEQPLPRHRPPALPAPSRRGRNATLSTPPAEPTAPRRRTWVSSTHRGRFRGRNVTGLKAQYQPARCSLAAGIDIGCLELRRLPAPRMGPRHARDPGRKWEAAPWRGGALLERCLFPLLRRHLRASSSFLGPIRSCWGWPCGPHTSRPQDRDTVVTSWLTPLGKGVHDAVSPDREYVWIADTRTDMSIILCVPPAFLG
jgi:hypothetical protein